MVGAPNPFDPGQIMRDVDEGAKRVETDADALAEATRKAGIAEMQYEQAFEVEVLKVYHEAKRAGERMPAEDVRKAIAHEKMEDEVYAAHLLAKANLAALEKRHRALGMALTARMSLLKALS